jgi:hypothetical protein
MTKQNALFPAYAQHVNSLYRLSLLYVNSEYAAELAVLECLAQARLPKAKESALDSLSASMCITLKKRPLPRWANPAVTKNGLNACLLAEAIGLSFENAARIAGLSRRQQEKREESLSECSCMVRALHKNLDGVKAPPSLNLGAASVRIAARKAKGAFPLAEALHLPL